MTKIFMICGLFILSMALVQAGFDKEKELEEFLKSAEKCRAETGASKEELQLLVEHQPATTKEGKCLKSCIMKHYQVMDANGMLSKAKAMECINRMFEGKAEKIKVATEILEECVAIQVKGDHCDAAEQYGKCLKESAIKHGVTEFDL